ncbi:MAG TPA: thiolase family protein, partial [Mycobacterium sp.]|nr:thiolase family protein [Mycobacterium sp.]
MIVSAVRTPFSRAFVGGLAGASEFVLAEHVVAAAIDRAGVAPESIDDILLGEVYQGGGCLARHTALALGLPPDTPGVAVGGFCASGMLAVLDGSGGGGVGA